MRQPKRADEGDVRRSHDSVDQNWRVDKCVPQLSDMGSDITPFAAKLAAARLSQTELRALVLRLGGRPLDPTTTSRWASGAATPPSIALAFLSLISAIPPTQLDEILRDSPPPPAP